MRFVTRLMPLAALAALAPVAAQAHTGLHAEGLATGLAHPFSGADHLLAMVAVGLWASSLRGAARFAVPASFITVMGLGAGLGAAGIALPGVEAGIVASVVLLGLLVAFEVRCPPVAASLLVGALAVFHGHAHGAEMPALASGLAYGLGFAAATAILHAAGFALGGLRPRFGAGAMRLLGGAVAGAGAFLMLGA